MFPVERGSPDGLTEALKTRLAELRGKGFNRLYQSERLFEFSTPESLLEIDFSKPLYALVDRLVIARNLHQRVVDALETCFREARSHTILKHPSSPLINRWPSALIPRPKTQPPCPSST